MSQVFVELIISVQQHVIKHNMTYDVSHKRGGGRLTGGGITPKGIWPDESVNGAADRSGEFERGKHLTVHRRLQIVLSIYLLTYLLTYSNSLTSPWHSRTPLRELRTDSWMLLKNGVKGGLIIEQNLYNQPQMLENRRRSVVMSQEVTE